MGRLQERPYSEWLSERKELLKKEKELNRLKDAINTRRRMLPTVRVDKEYRFVGPNGPATLSDLFEDQWQLIVYHFMFDPSWDKGCPSCSSCRGPASVSGAGPTA